MRERTTSGQTGALAMASSAARATVAGARMSLNHTVRLGLVQLGVGEDKSMNIQKMRDAVRSAATQGAKLVVLPECWNCPYGNKYFPSYAEPVKKGSASFDAMSDVAKENNVWLVGGSVPEFDDGKLYNTCCSFDPAGDFLGRFRKLHLFDIDVPGRIRFQESETLTKGDAPLVLDMEGLKVGIGICYDVRFPELSLLYRAADCNLLVYPGAFNLTTGPDHWHLLSRCRAVDTGCYVAMVSPARDMSASYHAYGHSLLVDPWGTVCVEAGEDESVVVGDLLATRLKEVRESIPTWNQRRHDVYTLSKT